jgi:CheY-like chemotaxis protein
VASGLKTVGLSADIDSGETRKEIVTPEPHTECKAGAVVTEEQVNTNIRMLRERMRRLTMLTPFVASGDFGWRVVNETVDILDVVACSIQAVLADTASVFGYCKDVVDASSANHIAAMFNSRVVSAGATRTFDDLGALFPGEKWIKDSGAHRYMGTPLVDCSGAIAGVAAVFGTRSRTFTEEDESWLMAAGQMVLACLGLDSRPSKPASSNAANLDQHPEEPRSPEPLRTERTMLVVDDDRQFNDAICEFLTIEGYKTVPAFNGKEALQIYRPSKHDMVIADIAMPVMNGCELAVELKLRSPKLPIILVTGYGSPEQNQDYLNKLGVSAVLNKPLDLNRLTTAIGLALKGG